MADYPGLQALPVAQPDGGRDAFAWILDGSPERRGTIVFQVKYVRRPHALKDPHKWIIETLKEEAKKVAALVEKAGAARYLLITNVPGTSHFGSGSIDRAQKALDDALEIPAQCWWRDDVVRRLDLLPALHWAFPELLTGADVLRYVVESALTEDADRRSAALRAFLTNQHDDDLQVRFREVELEIPLLDLFIDVPTSLGESRRRPRRKVDRLRQHLLQSRLAASLAIRERELPDDDLFLPSGDYYSHHRQVSIGAATLLLDAEVQLSMPRLVMEGAPGQGKSTLTQYLCQIHRMRLLNKPMDEVVEQHRKGPARLPFKVDLRDYALWLRKDNPFLADEHVGEGWNPSIESFLSAQIEHHSGGFEFSVADLAAVMRLSSVLLVFDGLDEVADIPTRHQVVEELTKGINRLGEHCLTLQVLVTSRPAAFANSPGFSPKVFDYLELGSITATLITQYAERWLSARRLHPSAAADVRRTLKTKLNQPHMRDLARNPMQLAILLSLIHTRGASLPDKRTALYDAYVETFFAREAEKSPEVRENRDLLIDIHRYIAWMLHSEAELRKSDGRVTGERLREVVSDYLAGEGHDPKLAESIFNGMVQRIVALVSRVEGTYEFEVQPLREYFAARHLYDTAPYAPPHSAETGTLPDRFDALIRDRYWLNVARFLAGCFSKGELASLVESVRGLANDPKYKHTVYPRQVARMLLTDWVFAQSPRLVESIVEVLADPFGLLDMSGAGRDMHQREPPSLPPRSGRELLVPYCMEFLDEQPASEFSDRVAALVRANADAGESYKTWWEFAATSQGPQRSKWIRNGLLLGVLHRASAEELEELLSDEGNEHPARLGSMLRAGHVDFCEMDEQRATCLVNAMLQNLLIVPLPNRTRMSPLLALSHALSFPRWTAYARQRRFDLIDVREGEPPAIAGARRVAEVYSELLGLPPEVSLHELDPWSRLIESGRAEFGDTPAWIPLVNCAADGRTNRDLTNGVQDLFDAGSPLADRARYARLRAGSFSWWDRMISRADTVFDKELAITLAISWAGPKTLPRILPRLDGKIRTLSSEEFALVARAVQALEGPFEERAGRALRIEEDFLIDMHARTATLLAPRVNDDGRAELHSRYVAGYEGRSSAILRFRAEQELGKNRWQKADPEAALRLTRRAYAAGAWIPRQLGRSRGRALFGATPEIANEVVREPLRYPVDLFALAESRLSQEARVEVHAVGAVAERDNWFG